MGNENAKEGESGMPRTTSSVQDGMIRTESTTSKDASKRDLVLQQERDREEREKRKKSKRATANKITFVQKAEFFDLFCGLDMDEDGFISEQQLADALRALGMRCRPRDMKRIQKEFDADKNGKYSFPEFLEIMAAQMREIDIEKFNQACPASAITEEDITREQVVYFKHLYTYFDSDSAGEIDGNDLRELLKSLGKTLTMDEINKIVATASTTKFTLTFYEFLNVVIAMGIPDDVIVTEEQAGTLSRRRTVSGRERALIKISKAMASSPQANGGDEDEIETKSSVSRKPKKTVRHKSAKSRKGDESSCDESTECSSTVLSDKGSNLDAGVRRVTATSHNDDKGDNSEERRAGTNTKDERRHTNEERPEKRRHEERRNTSSKNDVDREERNEKEGNRYNEPRHHHPDNQRWSDDGRGDRRYEDPPVDRSSRDYPQRMSEDLRHQMQMFQQQLAGIMSHISQVQPQLDRSYPHTARTAHPRDPWGQTNQVPPIYHSPNNGFFTARTSVSEKPIRQQTVFEPFEEWRPIDKGRGEQNRNTYHGPPTVKYVAPKIPEKKILPHIDRPEKSEVLPLAAVPSQTSDTNELAMRCKSLISQVKETSEENMKRDLEDYRRRTEDRVRISPTEINGKYIPPSVPPRSKPQKSFVVNADPPASPDDTTKGKLSRSVVVSSADLSPIESKNSSKSSERPLSGSAPAMRVNTAVIDSVRGMIPIETSRLHR